MSQRVLGLPAYVASLAPGGVEDARRLLSLTPQGATAIEWRLDLTKETMSPCALLDLDARPAVMTWRTAREGGAFDGSAEEYRRRVLEAYASGATVDVELSSGFLSENGALPERRRVVASAHFPFGIPEDWETQLSAMVSTGVRASKLVAGVGDLPEGLRIAAIQRRHRKSAVSIFPMGPASAAGRVLSALSGGALVYGSVGPATAGGQLSLSDLLGTYRVHAPRRIEALFGIVGAEVSGSLSPFVHNALFQARELPSLYLPLPIADFDRTRPQELEFDPPFRGFSVTKPWKRRAAATATPSADVSAAGAANTLVLVRGRWRAENTDVDGIFDLLADHDTGEGRTAVILGAGGVARAAIVAARKLGYEVLVTSRRDSEADSLAGEFRVDPLAWEDVARSEADVYINATALGSSVSDPPAVPAAALSQRPLVFDCVYRRDGSPTPTIRAAKSAGCRTVEGLQLFAAQAVRQARIFGVEDAALEEVTDLLQPARVTS